MIAGVSHGCHISVIRVLVNMCHMTYTSASHGLYSNASTLALSTHLQFILRVRVFWELWDRYALGDDGREELFH